MLLPSASQPKGQQIRFFAERIFCIPRGLYSKQFSHKFTGSRLAQALHCLRPDTLLSLWFLAANQSSPSANRPFSHLSTRSQNTRFKLFGILSRLFLFCGILHTAERLPSSFKWLWLIGAVSDAEKSGLEQRVSKLMSRLFCPQRETRKCFEWVLTAKLILYLFSKCS